MRVLKFGGACLVSRQRLERVVDVVRQTPDRCVVVVSAVQGVTDRLHRLASPTASGAIAEALVELERMHLELAPPRHDIAGPLHGVLSGLARVMRGAGRGLDPDERERVISTGERLAAVLVTAHLRAVGVEAEVFSSERAGIVCHGGPGAASIDLPATRSGLWRQLCPALERDAVPVVTGYYGVDASGTVATFGRSGTDYTATMLAAALDAERVEMWKVVGGFLNADPEIFPNAHIIPQLSYAEAAELAFCGAEVMHPRALDPARGAEIPIHILDLEQRQGEGSWIASEPSHDNGALTAISSRRGLSMLRAYSPAAHGRQEAMAVIARTLADSGVNVLNTTTAQASLGILIEASGAERAQSVIEQLPPETAEWIELVDGMALVCAVGHGIGHTRGLVGRVLCAVVRAGVEVEMVCSGASPVACHLTVPDAQVESASRAIHREFFTKDAPCDRQCVYSQQRQLQSIERAEERALRAEEACE